MRSTGFYANFPSRSASDTRPLWASERSVVIDIYGLVSAAHDRLRRVLGDRRHDVGVEVQRHANSRMTEPFRDHLGMHSGLQRQGRVGVSEIMQPNPRYVELAD